MQNKPVVSVIMCVYNTKKEYFYDAVSSILNQTLQNFELLIINDGSQISYDDFPFNDKRIVFLNNEINKGISFSRNLGLKFAKGEFIAIMDSDDIALENRLKSEVQFLEKNPEVVACGTWFKFIGAKNHEAKRVLPNRDYFRSCLFFGNSPTILDPSSMMRKNVLEKYNLFYDENVKIGMDYIMWINLLEKGEIKNVPEVLMHYRVHNNQITKSAEYAKHKSDRYFYLLNLKKIGLELTNEEIDILISSDKVKGVNLYSLVCEIESIKKSNRILGYYNIEEFEKRCDEQIRKAILINKNIFWILKYLFKRKTRKIVLKTELKRLF